jgi:ligand-binding SRPBCC domain-containing protein
MPKRETTITINAPVEKVFSYLQDEPTNLLEIWPSMVEVKDKKRLPNGGTSFRWVYKMVGMRFEGTSEDIEYISNQRVVTKTKGGIEATYTWTFQPEDSGTKMTVEVKWSVPVPVLGKLAEALIIRQQEREFDLVLANLKDKMEV